jgi:hypothetical protein
VSKSLFQHDGRHIAPTLRFQDLTFLADYAAMQQSPTHLNAESPRETATEVQNNSQLAPTTAPASSVVETANLPAEIGGRDGPEPTRFGDWEKAGRCIDF